MAKQEQGAMQYINASAEDYSDKVQELLAQERAAYEILKAARADVLAQVRQEETVGEGLEIKQTCYTRWGQWQIVIGPKDKPKAASTARQSLTEWRAAQAAGGHRQ